MSRVHLIEFHEQPWVPAILREGATDYLRKATEVAGQYDLVLPLLKDMLQDEVSPKILDLGSGAGGGWGLLLPKLKAKLDREVQVTLSDYQPNVPALARTQAESGGSLEFASEPVDALRVPSHLTGLRTLFNLFHHFRPQEARQILADADEKKQPILIIEALDNRLIQAILIVLLSPILVWLLTPLIKPFRLGRLIFTYLIPLIPLIIAWDGCVSVLRLYGPKEMKAMTNGLDNLSWKSGKLQHKGNTVLYLQGEPK
ncbi:MAG: hypothetical protein AAF804_09685 [Bacteroidota bacterium]